MAYFDLMEKIVPISGRPMAIAETGEGLLGDSFVHRLLQDFERTLVGDEGVQTVGKKLFDFFRTEAPSPTGCQGWNTFLVAGFEAEKPFLCAVDVQAGEWHGGPGCGFIRSADTEEAPPQAPEEMSLDEAIEFSERSIVQWGGRDENWRTVGGPNDVLIIEPKGWRWHCRKDLPFRPKTMTEFIAAGKRGDFAVTLIPPFTDADLPWK